MTVSVKLSTLLLLTLITSIYGHGMMCTPRQRGAYHSTKCGSNMAFPKNPVTDYCAHCLNGGTVFTVANNLPRSGWSNYDPINDVTTAARAGLCGDAYGKNDHMIGGKFMPYDKAPLIANWKTGSVVDFEAELDTNHNGYFEFFLCNLDKCGSKDISGKCMKDGHCYRLNRVPHSDCQNPSEKTHYECGPIDSKHPSRWYVPCRKTGHVGVHLVGGNLGTMRYQLPKGMSCRHCVVQWYWATANSCAPKGFLDYFERYNNPFGTSCDSDGGGRGAHRKGMTECGGRLVPEEFWSCADVEITPGGGQSIPKDNWTDGSQDMGMSSELAGDASDMQTDDQATEGMKDPSSEMPAEELDMKPEDPMESNSKKGTCIKQNESCDARIPCCGSQTVCVHTKTKGFVCKLWYILWQETSQMS